MIRTEVRMGWKSIPGQRHRVEGRENEDAVLLVPEHPYFDALMLIADGMGGHPEPRLAAQTAAAAARDFLKRPERLDEILERGAEPEELLRRAVEQANRQVRHLASRSPSLRSCPPQYAGTAGAGWGGENPPGCTLTLAGIANGRLAVAHVGDGSVFLLRSDAFRLLAGGEARRRGNRPEEYLGRADSIEIETVTEAVRAGDRLLLCTDGLTRYFGEGGQLPEARLIERLQRVIARAADPQTLASQLTSDGRGEEYDDDTSVVVAEIGASREAPDPRPLETERPLAPAVSPNAPRGRPLDRASGVFLVLLGMVLAAAGSFGWQAWRASRGREEPALKPYAAPAVDLSSLPRGGVPLVSPESGRFFVLKTRPEPLPVPSEPLILRKLRFDPRTGLKDSGLNFRLDLGRGRLIDPNGRSFPVTVDTSSGTIEIDQAGTLVLSIRPAGLPVWIDGVRAGTTPLSVAVPAGRHAVELRGRSGREVLDNLSVEVPQNATVTLKLQIPYAQTAGGS